MKRVWILLGGLLLASPAWALQIADVQASHLRFDPTTGEQVRVDFALDEPASVVLRWFDGLDRPVAASAPQRFEAGAHGLTWDGLGAASGQPVPPEAYVFVLEAVDANGKKVVHDLTDRTGGEPVRAEDIRWDPATGFIHYALPVPARINVRIGLKNNGPLLATVLDWVPREPGADRFAWNGKDASGVLELATHPELAILVDAYSLSANTVIVGPPQSAVHLAAAPLGRGETRPRDGTPRKRMHYHAHQPLDQRGDVAISVHAVDANGDTVRGRVALRLDVDPKDRQRILATRFEPVFFVDGTFAFENEVGFLPTTWVWDTTRVNNGWHYINVNVRGYEGNFGMATLKLKVDNPPTSSPAPGAAAQ
jgi:hypothetical protein